MTRDRKPWIAVAIPIALGALLGCTRLGSLDLPLMLENGRVILETGEIPRTNVFSWVNGEHAYLNDKWGFMVLVAGVGKLAGSAGLSALKMLFGALMGGLLHLLARRALPLRPAAVTACVALTMLSYRLHLRAEWISYLGAAATLLLVPRVDAGDRRATVLQIALMPFWIQFIPGGGWAIFHVVVVTLQAFIFMMLTIVYIALVHADDH